MFTGIVEELGTIRAVTRTADCYRLTVECSFDDIHLGDSIAVNGVCLTASAVPSNGFVADVMPETLNRTCFQKFKRGTSVNLERAMRAGGRFGGHIVSGHIDGVGTILSKRPDGNAVLMLIQTDPRILRYIVEKGSVAIDGVSLTVTEVEKQHFGVSLIPHTIEHTTIHFKNTGDMINLECDIIGKYVEKLIQPYQGQPEKQGLTKEFLEEYGF